MEWTATGQRSMIQWACAMTAWWSSKKIVFPSVKMLHNSGMNTETTQTVYDAAGSLDGLLRLALAWHARVLEDEVVSHAFSHGIHPQHTERLAAYWAEALGGPTMYSSRYQSHPTPTAIRDSRPRMDFLVRAIWL